MPGNRSEVCPLSRRESICSAAGFVTCQVRCAWRENTSAVFSTTPLNERHWRTCQSCYQRMRATASVAQYAAQAFAASCRFDAVVISGAREQVRATCSSLTASVLEESVRRETRRSDQGQLCAPEVFHDHCQTNAADTSCTAKTDHARTKHSFVVVQKNPPTLVHRPHFSSVISTGWL